MQATQRHPPRLASELRRTARTLDKINGVARPTNNMRIESSYIGENLDDRLAIQRGARRLDVFQRNGQATCLRRAPHNFSDLPFTQNESPRPN